MGEAAKTGHVRVHPCGPHLRARGKHRGGVTPRTPAPGPFRLALSCPGGARGQKGPRGAPVPGRAATPTGAARPGRGPAARLSGDSRLCSSRVSWRCHPRPLELCPGLGGRAAAFAGVASVPREGTGSRRPLGGSRRAAHTAPGGPRPPGRPDAPLVPGVRLGAGSRPCRARRPRQQTGGRELGSCARRRAPPRFPSVGPRRLKGRSLLPGGIGNLVRLRLGGL